MKSSSFVEDNEEMKILLVEDEEKLAKNIKIGLEKQGYTVYYFLSGEKAEEYFYKYVDVIDLLLLDSMLPGKSGIEVCTNIRKTGIKTPILMLTAKDTPQDIILGLDSGIDDYLTKPFSLDVLLARIRALLRRTQKNEHLIAEMRINNLILNTSTRKVFYKGIEITLTLKEFNLLEYLMQNPNKVLERENILEKIWDINYDSFSNVVDVHIKNIRKKLKEVYGENVLETIRGVGYRIKK